jgi:hypothetical protein
VFTIALSFIFLTLAANFIVDQYLRGVVRNAVDEGARAGAQLGAAPNACVTRAQQVMGNLAGGPLGRTITVTCSTNGADVIATGHASLKGWLPAVPTWTFTVEGISVVEQGPA